MQMLAPLAFPTSPSVATLRQWSVQQVIDDDGFIVQLASGMISETRMRLTSQMEQFEGAKFPSSPEVSTHWKARLRLLSSWMRSELAVKRF